MIVRRDGTVLYLIAQPDHAALARRVMERWVPLHDADRRASILLAVEEHDNGWRELDDAPMVHPETGRPFDFINAPVPQRQGVWPRGISRLARHDAWAAALVAQHALTIYERYRGDAEWTDFFATIAGMRDGLAAQEQRTAEQLAHDYAFVRIGDLISLIFCQQWNEEQAFEGWTFQRAGDRVLIAPDGFAEKEVPVAVVAREIADVRYDSDEALRQALRTAPRRTLTGACVGATTRRVAP
jgi:hypothetical protein